MRLVIKVVAWLFFVTGATLTTLHFVQPDLPQARQAVAYVPWAVPLLGLAFLLFLGQVYFPGKGRWQIALGLAAVSLGGLVLGGWWVSPQYAGAHPTAAAGTETIRVLTLDLGNGLADPTSVVSTAVSSGADIVVLQRVTSGMLDRMDQSGLNEAFPHRAGEVLHDGTFGTLLMSTAPLGEVSYLGATQSSVSATVTLPQGSVRTLAVGVVSPSDGATSKRWAADLAQLATVALQQHPTLVAGAFEASFDHAAFRDLLDAGLRDAGERANAGFMPTWPVGSRFGVPLPRLTQPDHILIGAPLVAGDQRTLAVPGADHRALLARVAFR